MLYFTINLRKMNEILSDSNYALLTYDKDRNLLELIWKSSCPCEDYRKIFNDVITRGKSKSIHFFLSDIRYEGVVPMDNLRWLRKNIIPQASTLGIKKIAIILNKELFARIYTDLLMKHIKKNNMNMKTFFNKEDALKWLK